MNKLLTLFMFTLLWTFISCNHDGEDLPVQDQLTIEIIEASTDYCFDYEETKTLTFTSEGVKTITFTKPNGWEVSIKDNTLSITAPTKSNTSAEKEGIVTLIGANGDYSCKTELPVKIEVTTTAINLSKSGTANCYIISEGGEYMFDATKRGNGSSEDATITLISEMKADWLWITKDMEQEITDISLDLNNGYIFFKAAGKDKGNAVVALIAADGKIIWSWHIWFTDQPETVTYPNGRVLQDRSLGAIGKTPGSTEAYGLYYQWGRKDPFCGGTTTETSATAFAEANANSVINPAYIDAHTWKQETGTTTLTIEYAIAHPLSFLSHKNTTGAYDWLTKGKADLWNTQKTIYDPCPAGYKVPDHDTWNNFADSSDRYIDGTSEWDGEKYGMTYMYNGGSDWYPTQGYRNRDKGNLVGLGNTRTGHYWSNHRMGSQIYRLYISKRLSSGKLLQPQATSSDAAYGYNIRCCKES